MADRIINQFGDKPIYIERNEGQICIGEYAQEAIAAFKDGSFDLYDYTPTISPAIHREEVEQLKDWIEKDAAPTQSARLALLYGKAGIGKSVVMHDLLLELQAIEDYLVLGLKSDQIEFIDTADLGHKMHMVQPMEVVVREMAQRFKRVVLLIDQIDALSLSLSSNRTPLRSLIKLIEQTKNIPHVRIVISCRPYDLEYDPLLDSLRVKNKWELKEFTKDQVVHILRENNCEERISDNLLRFLGNPLHLFLFLKVKPYEQLTNPLATDLLYHQLWRKFVTDDSHRKVDKERLLDLLDALVTTMYKRQELSVHIRAYETEYNAELNYLFSSGWLLCTKSGHVQFFHQTLFDYVYARRFVEHGYNLLDILKARHQGLFSRAAVKSVLTFLREQNPTEYINNIDHLLYDKNNDGLDTYRYHLKSLALSNMAYFESPIQEEISLISRKVFSDKPYMDVIFESVHTEEWFKAIWSIIDGKGGWLKLGVDNKDKAIQMCQRSLWSNADVVLDAIEHSLDYDNEADCKYIGNLLQYYELNCDSEKLIAFYNRLVKNRLPLEYTHLLRNILKSNPDFVCRELKENIRLQLLEKESIDFNRITLDSDEESLYEELLKRHHKRAIRLLIELLELIYDSTRFEVEGSDIFFSMEFFNFERITGEHYITHFTQDAVNIIIDDFLNNVFEEDTRRLLSEFSKSKDEGFVFIALYVYSSYPELFKDEIHEIIIKREVLFNAPSWVEYQAVEALKVTFYCFSTIQKTAIIDRILSIQDKGEKRLYDKNNLKWRLQYGHPILDIDIHEGKALEVIPIEELRSLSWKAYQERQRIDRKFNKARLKNGKPSSLSVHAGWSSLSEEQGLKMSCKTWFKSMLKYNSNPHDYWEKPSLTGQCELFRKVVGTNPEKYIGLIDDIIKCEKIQLDYPQAGMQGLIDAGRIEDAEHVLQGILGVINNDVNSNARGFNIHSLLFVLSDLIKVGNVSEGVVRLLCNTLLDAKEPEEDQHWKEKEIYNVGINQARGHAGYMLVNCARYEKYKEVIFSTIERIAATASVYTRAAILLNMAALNHMDQNRSVTLFKELMHDYDPRLMSLPVHNYNPLVYFVNYAVDELMDFFNHAADCPDCYHEQVVILWLAWSHNERNERIKVLLDKMCDSSQEARLSLTHFFGTLKNDISDDAICYILHFMKGQFDSPKMGEACDDLFRNINLWPVDMQIRVAEVFVSSPLSSHGAKSFVKYLAGYAIKDPIQTLKWLERIMNASFPKDYHDWNIVVDVIIQAYNGIKLFNDKDCQDPLEHAMDLIDNIMQNPNNKYLVVNFINKLDNE